MDTVPPPNWGEPPWQVRWSPPQVELPERADAVVIGAGVTGLAAARALARRGLSVAVLEAGRIGSGATARSGGLVLEDTAAGPRAEVQGCIPALGALIESEGIECDLALPGCWELIHLDAGATDGPGWAADGARLAIAAEVPGGTLDPGRLVEGLARSALRAGAQICERTPVLGLEPGPEATLFAGEREIVARHVVAATGAYTPGLVPLPEELQAVLTLAVATGPFERSALGLDHGRGFYTEDRPYLWGRALGEDRAVFGAGLVAAPKGDLLQTSLSQQEPRALFARLEQRVREFHPTLARVRIEQRWGGPVCFRPGGDPLVCRHPQFAQVILIGAYAGHGLALGPRLAEYAADAILRETPLPDWGALRSP